MLLSKFSRPNIGTGRWGDEWKVALGEDAAEALRRFVGAGLLVPCSLPVKLASKFSSVQLKGMLKQRGLKLSGRKDEMIERLCEGDRVKMERAVADLYLLTCSDAGRQLADEFVGRRDKMHLAAFAALRDRNIVLACQVVCDFQDALGFPEIPMFPSKPYLPDVRSVFAVKPGILAGVNEEALEHLRLAAGMAFLGLGDHWLPENLETGIRLSGPAAVSMIIGAVQNWRNVESWRNSGLVRTVRIVCSAGGPCETCASLADRVWPIGELPEIPNAHCTSPYGCRCACVADLIKC
jgi:hypothetical protein